MSVSSPLSELRVDMLDGGDGAGLQVGVAGAARVGLLHP